MIDLFNLIMFAVMGAYFLVMLYIFGRAVWQWASEPFRIAYELEENSKIQKFKIPKKLKNFIRELSFGIGFIEIHRLARLLQQVEILRFSGFWG